MMRSPTLTISIGSTASNCSIRYHYSIAILISIFEKKVVFYLIFGQKNTIQSGFLQRDL